MIFDLLDDRAHHHMSRYFGDLLDHLAFNLLIQRIGPSKRLAKRRVAKVLWCFLIIALILGESGWPEHAGRWMIFDQLRYDLADKLHR